MKNPLPVSRRRAVTWGLASCMLVSVAGAAVPASAADGAPDEVTKHIVNGEFPSAPEGAVSLYAPSHGGFSCSASRIGPQWVLTARHCADLRPTRAYTNSIGANQGEHANVAQIINAPDGDVALLKLDSTPPGKVLPYSGTPLRQGDQVLMQGWGMTSSGGAASPRLKSATGSFLGSGTNPYYRGEDLLIKGGTGSPWKGDSGGPVTKDGVLYGALSWSESYGVNPQSRSGYGSVVRHAAWVQQHTGIAPNTTNAPQPPNGNAPQPPNGNNPQPPNGNVPQPPNGNAPQPPNGNNPQPPNVKGPQPPNVKGAQPSPSSTSSPAPDDKAPLYMWVTPELWPKVKEASEVRPVAVVFCAVNNSDCDRSSGAILGAHRDGKESWSLALLDVEKNKDLTKESRVTKMPTVVFYWKGKEIPDTRHEGVLSQDDMKGKAEKAKAWAKDHR
ncbi:hypothetical protein KEM60_02455 [Austwickia sp. TVS 96-490-7B]|uniref:trypsin-like serine protease n=1 Tax=Austwickia sp. TVS 96-490-7B TaxID=2830843 RepID=UPI001C566AD3|nr:trypsin-like serine protease [Austwickia sp. TVS 96-490-7B]MBW3086244.1 hypothetical protein [Austwickia sp. TVS 96-490-7B]